MLYRTIKHVCVYFDPITLVQKNCKKPGHNKGIKIKLTKPLYLYYHKTIVLCQGLCCTSKRSTEKQTVHEII